MASTKVLIASRGYCRQQITKRCNTVRDKLDQLNEYEVNEHMACLKSIRTKLEDFDGKLSEVIFSEEGEEKFVEELKMCEHYDVLINATLVQLQFKCKTKKLVTEDTGYSLKMPDLPMPTYSHSKGECVERFLRDFESITANLNIDSYTKLVLLQKQLKNEPLMLVKSLSVEDRKYESAKDLLMEAFGSTVNRKFEAIKVMTEMQLNFRIDPYNFVSEMRLVMDSFKHLNISTEDVMQYFFINAMDKIFKDHLTQVTGKSKPSLVEINAHIFEVTERYLESRNLFSSKKVPTSAVADKTSTADALNNSVAVSPESLDLRHCILCKLAGGKNDHHISSCKVFVDAKAKLDRLRFFNRCVKCTGNHLTNECKFQFRYKCKLCPQFHFTFLCNKENPREKHPKPALKTNNVVGHEMDNQCNVVLPTFTVTVRDGSLIRCLKDNCSQLSFIRDDIANAQNCEVISGDVKITINGFNEAKLYKTKVVKFECFLGGVLTVINAVCIPKIRTNFDLPELLPIVNAFIAKGYQLADNYLMQENFHFDNFGFVLGSDYEHCLPTTSLVINPSSPSTYLNSPIGVLFIGNLKRLHDNLPFITSKMAESPQISDTLSSPPSSFAGREGDYQRPICNEFAVDLIGCESYREPGQPDEDIVLDKMLKDDHDLLTMCKAVLDEDEQTVESNRENEEVVEFILNSATRDSEGRIVLPLPWKGNVSHLLAKNESLAFAILQNVYSKYKSKPELLKMIDDTFRDQVDNGVIEVVSDLDSFKEENPFYSFLPHMPVFRLAKDTSKCRVVYLSNLKQGGSGNSLAVSHNQAMLAGPCMNSKISTAIMQLRFEKYLLCFDINKAFLSIGLKDFDQARLLLFWFKNIMEGDTRIMVYKHNRLPFGLKPSPTLLMLALYKILIVDVDDDSDKGKSLKKLIYCLSCMDNLAVTANSAEYLLWAYNMLDSIFNGYKFYLQQFFTNSSSLQEIVDGEFGATTDERVKLLGLTWSRSEDTLSTVKLELNPGAVSKRQILSSIASNYDIFNFNAPLLNRARLFFQKLQYMKDLNWDEPLSKDMHREWINIAAQVNMAPEISLPRSVGKRTDSYKLVAFTDASKSIYATVLYIKNITSGEVNFLMSRNRLVNRNLATKTIPCLEFFAIALGTEVLHEVRTELGGPRTLCPINIVGLELFTDSTICLNWISLHVNKMDKMKNVSAAVMNRLNTICRLCDNFPVTFSFCEGGENPADMASRPVSYKQLSKSTFFTGPPMLKDMADRGPASEFLRITVPNPHVGTLDNLTCGIMNTFIQSDPLLKLDRFSSYSKLVHVQRYVLKFINNMKMALKKSNPYRYEHIKCSNELELHKKASLYLIKVDQQQEFKDIFEYYNSKPGTLKSVPDLINRYNIFPDEQGVLRVRSKYFREEVLDHQEMNPILLSKTSPLTKSIIWDLHIRTKHAGFYTLLAEVRKQFFIIHCFSVLKRVVRSCSTCKRFNNRPVQLNQNSYRMERICPPNIPFRYVFIDHIGPFNVKEDRKKIWLLIITCMWSRAVNLVICHDLSTNALLRALQLHIFQFGLPEKIFSDLGSQMVSGMNVIKSFLSDTHTSSYLAEKGICSLQFCQYFKGNSALGSMVESCVKIVKKLIFGSIRKNILSLYDFEFLIAEVIHIANKRPVAFKDCLRDTKFVPAHVTPEMLLKGCELISLNIIPDLQPVSSEDTEWDQDYILSNYSKLQKIRSKLRTLYNEDFLGQMILQATNSKSRYVKKPHTKLQKGDLVLIKEKMQKPINYEMARVMDVIVNNLNETTGAFLLKGNGSRVKYHSESLIPLNIGDVCTQEQNIGEKQSSDSRSDCQALEEQSTVRKNERQAAQTAKHTIKCIYEDGIVD